MKFRKRDWILTISGLVVGILITALFFPAREVSHDESIHDHSEAIVEWTCSMHPQIRQSEPGTCPICGMDLIPVSDALSSSAGHDHFSFSMSEEASALANVQTTRAAIKEAGRDLFLTGKVVLNEHNISSISANFSGRIENLLINYTGQEVERGQKLATIYSPELISAQQELLEANKNKNKFPLLYEAAKERLKLWNISETQIDEIENEGKVRSLFDIYATTDGIVESRYIAQGDYVTKGMKLFDIVSLKSVWVFLDAYESDLQWLNTGDHVTFTVSALPGEEFHSTINYIDPFLNQEKRTANIRLEINNSHKKIKPGMFVNATASSRSEKALVIPVSAVLWTGPRSVVYIKVPNNDTPTFEMREVVLGARAGKEQIILSGLSEGEEVVISGTFAIDAAAQLRGNYSMMHRPTESKTLTAPHEFLESLSSLINNYINIKQALVNSNLDNSIRAAEQLQHQTEHANAAKLSGEAKDVWTKLHENIMLSSAKIISATSLEEARETFEILSESIIETMEGFQPGHITYYVDYCPMALDNKGAYWLSETEEILNPYFGESMLRCGEITKTFEAHHHQ